MAATDVLIVAETRDGKLRPLSLELVTAARQIAGDGKVDALVAAAGQVSGLEALGAHGADGVLVATHDAFKFHSPDGLTAVAASLGANYGTILFLASAAGRDVAPRVAARLGAPCASDVVAVERTANGVRASRPIYAGKVLQALDLAGTAVVTLRPNSLAAVPNARAGAVEAVTVPAFDAKVTVTGVRSPDVQKLDVSEATVVVSGGRGFGDPKHFVLLEELAAAFGNAAVGASRAVVDAGWRAHDEQVGQTGKTVAPSLYIAVGISGAIQHLAGMRTAKVIVAINKDKEAPIFKAADYGIVGDLFEVLPRLTEEIRKLKQHA